MKYPRQLATPLAILGSRVLGTALLAVATTATGDDRAPLAAWPDDPFERPAERSVHAPQEAPHYRVVRVDSDDTLNIRDMPGVRGSTVVGRLAPDATHVRLGESRESVNGGTWVTVRDRDLPAGKGWVNAAFLESMSAADEGGFPPDILSPPLGDLARLYTGLDGFTHLEAEALDSELQSRLGQDEQAFHHISRMNPLTRALLLVQQAESPLEKGRYRLRYGMADLGPYPPKGYTTSVSFIQLDRLDLSDSGQHLSYRFVMGPVQNRTASLISMSRASLSERVAQGLGCIEVACTAEDSAAASINASIDDTSDAPWEDEASVDIAFQPPYALHSDVGTHSAAAVLDQLILEQGFYADRAQNYIRWRYPEFAPEGVTLAEPFIEVVLEVNMAQEFAVDGVLQESHLMDDDAAVIWHRVMSVASADPEAPLVMHSRAVRRHQWRQDPLGPHAD